MVSPHPGFVGGSGCCPDRLQSYTGRTKEIWQKQVWVSTFVVAIAAEGAEHSSVFDPEQSTEDITDVLTGDNNELVISS